MKFIRLATIAALSTTILAGGATVVSADEVREVTTNGQVQFTADEEGELEVIPPEVDPDVEVEPEIPGTTGPLSIVKAATMNFGSQVISNTSNTQNNVLTGAEIEFVDSRIQYEGSNTENAPSAHAAGLTLLPNEAARSVMTAAQGQGAGASSVVWGNQADLMAQFEADGFDPETGVVENSAIRLSIPGSTAKDATTYTSTLTWELTSTPGDEV